MHSTKLLRGARNTWVRKMRDGSIESYKVYTAAGVWIGDCDHDGAVTRVASSDVESTVFSAAQSVRYD